MRKGAEAPILATVSQVMFLIPTQRPTRLILSHSRLKKVFLFLEIDQLTHPRKRIVGAGVEWIETDLLAAAVGDEAQIFLELRRIQSEHAAGHGVFGITIFELDAALHERADFVAEFLGPQMGGFPA